MTLGENKHETLVFMLLLERSGNKIDLGKVTKKAFLVTFFALEKSNILPTCIPPNNCRFLYYL